MGRARDKDSLRATAREDWVMRRVRRLFTKMEVVGLLVLVLAVSSAPVGADADSEGFFEGFEEETVGQAPSGWLGFGFDGNYIPLVGPNDFFVDDMEFLTGGKSMRVAYLQPSPDIVVVRPLGETLFPPVEFIWNEKHEPFENQPGTQHFLALVTGTNCGLNAADTCQAVGISIAPHPNDKLLGVDTTYNGQWGRRFPNAPLPFSGGYDWTEFRVVWDSDNLVHVYIDSLLIRGNVPIDPGLTFDTIRWVAGSCCHTGDFWFDDIQVRVIDDDADDDDADDDEGDEEDMDDGEDDED